MHFSSFFFDPGSPDVIQLETLSLPINKDHGLYSFLVKIFKYGSSILSNQLASIKNKSSLKAAVSIYRSLTTGYPKIRTIFALVPIDVKLGTMREIELTNHWSSSKNITQIYTVDCSYLSTRATKTSSAG